MRNTTYKAMGDLEVLIHLIDECDEEENLFLVQLAELVEFEGMGGNLTEILKDGYVEKEIRSNGNLLLSIEKDNRELEIVEFTKERIEFILSVIKEDLISNIILRSRRN